MYKKWIGAALCLAFLAIGIELYLVRNLWTNPPETEVFVFKTEVKTGQEIEESNLQKIEIQKEQVPNGVIKDHFKWVGTKAQKDFPSNMLLKASDFESPKGELAVRSLVLRLDYEQGHKGEMKIGEKVGFLCYRQGEVKLIGDLTVVGNEKDLQNMGGEGCYITVSGKAEDLEILVLAKKEGSLHLIKKTAVHN